MKIDAAIKRTVGSPGSSGNLTSASLNGKSFTFGTTTAPGVTPMVELNNQKNILMKWLNWCDGISGPSNRATAVFLGKVSYGFPYC